MTLFSWCLDIGGEHGVDRGFERIELREQRTGAFLGGGSACANAIRTVARPTWWLRANCRIEQTPEFLVRDAYKSLCDPAETSFIDCTPLRIVAEPGFLGITMCPLDSD